MLTEWGKKLDRSAPLPEYPRPQMRRESWINLNGPWEYAFCRAGERPDVWQGEITVPFSPESELSGVGRSLSARETLWYRRVLEIPEAWAGRRVLLHFGAVDQSAEVYLNGAKVCRHDGGYTPFSAELRGARSGDELTVAVTDVTDASWQSRGKQSSHPGGIWYTPQSGIWQTVWLEAVPQTYISALRITPLPEQSALELTVLSEGGGEAEAKLCGKTAELRANVPSRIPLEAFEWWSPEHPKLYDLTVTLGEDRVESYFAMRSFGVETDAKGAPRLTLNGRPYFQTGLLDQGYWCDGLLTPPSDAAMVHDIESAKAAGFNLLRKHIKVEPLRWYYHCDRLGMLVWQDMVNGGGRYNPTVVTVSLFTGVHLNDHAYRLFARQDPAGRAQYYRELDEMVEHLYNCPCIAMWVPFNEGWGQFDAAEAVHRILQKDLTRPIDHASGWHDQGIGRVKSLHVYFRPYRYSSDRKGRAVVLSEFGGFNYELPGHSFAQERSVYKKFGTPEALFEKFRETYEQEILPAARQGLSACVYTQLTDVETELNGLLTYDRAVFKLPPDRLRVLNAALLAAGSGAEG